MKTTFLLLSLLGLSAAMDCMDATERLERCLDNGYEATMLENCTTIAVADEDMLGPKATKKCVNAEKFLIKDCDETSCNDVIMATGTPAPTGSSSTEPAPTEASPTEPAPTEPASTEPAPTEPAATEPTAEMPSWPQDFAWSSAGALDGYTCVQISEASEPASHTWNDNFFCSKAEKLDPGFSWSSAGSIAGQKCINTSEGSDPDTWEDNFPCVPSSSPYNFQWNSAGPISGMDCIQWLETSDPDTWEDNYLCNATY